MYIEWLFLYKLLHDNAVMDYIYLFNVIWTSLPVLYAGWLHEKFRLTSNPTVWESWNIHVTI
jgi:hypothetical protein